MKPIQIDEFGNIIGIDDPVFDIIQYRDIRYLQKYSNGRVKITNKKFHVTNHESFRMGGCPRM